MCLFQVKRKRPAPKPRGCSPAQEQEALNTDDHVTVSPSKQWKQKTNDCTWRKKLKRCSRTSEGWHKRKSPLKKLLEASKNRSFCQKRAPRCSMQHFLLTYNYCFTGHGQTREVNTLRSCERLHWLNISIHQQPMNLCDQSLMTPSLHSAQSENGIGLLTANQALQVKHFLS